MKIKFIAVIALALTFVACGEKGKEKENTTPNVPTIKNGLKIAYYIQDSLKTAYTYYREMDSTMKVKQTKFQAELERKQKALQKYVSDNEQLAKAGQLSPESIASVQQQAQRSEQALYQYQQTEGARLEEETVEILNVLTKRIEAAGKKYCEKHKIDLLLIHGPGSQFNFIDPSMEITKEFVAFLNQYDEEIKATVNGKDKK